ncbi:MAG: recombinase family protein [Romboutsia timonensis]
MKIYLYCRISTKKQSITRQISNLKEAYPEGKIIEEVWTGTTLQRPKFERLLKQVKPGDLIAFDEISRMSRDSEEGFQLYEKLFNEGIELSFLKEPHLNTKVYRSKIDMSFLPQDLDNKYASMTIDFVKQLLLELAKDQIRLAFERSEAEVRYLRERTKEGIKERKESGLLVGRPVGRKVETNKSKEAKEKIKKFSKSFSGMLEDPEVIKICGVHRNTYYRYKREIKEELNQN